MLVLKFVQTFLYPADVFCIAHRYDLEPHLTLSVAICDGSVLV